MKDCLTSGDLGGIVADLWAFPTQRVAPSDTDNSAGFSKASKSWSVSQSSFLGAGSVALRKRYFQKRAFQSTVPSQLL